MEEGGFVLPRAGSPYPREERRAVDDLMRRAIELAAQMHPHPNPRVGALVLDRAGTVIAEAAHEGPGRPHAEAAALRQAGQRAAGGTLVVTLEPCRHHGRTPPCTEAIFGAGIAQVVYGADDPDERVAGEGAADLQGGGVEVIRGVLADEVEAADPGYFHQRRTGRPLITLKVAATLDGQAAAADGTSQWITSSAARADGHRLRAEADAVVVGAGTVLADDPRLTVRLAGHEGPQPQAVVIAGTRPLPPDAAVFAGKALVYSPVPAELPAEVVVLPDEDGAHVDLTRAITDMGERGLLAALVEGGPRLASSVLRAGLVDRVAWYVAPRLAAGTGLPAVAGSWATLADAVPLRIVGAVRIGPDLRVDLEPEEG